MPVSIVSSIHKRLKQLRLQSGMTQEQFSEISGISYKYYQAMEAGRRRDLRLSTLERLAGAYSVGIHILLAPDLPKLNITKQMVGKIKKKRSN